MLSVTTWLIAAITRNAPSVVVRRQRSTERDDESLQLNIVERRRRGVRVVQPGFVPARCVTASRCSLSCEEEQMPETMTVQWQHDADAALDEARRSNRPVLVDFTAAPT